MGKKKKITKNEKEWINQELENLKDPNHFRFQYQSSRKYE
jgi:hypothetical protein